MRTCRCGCNRSLSGMHGRMTWHPLCSPKAKYAKKQREKQRERNKQLMRLAKKQNVVQNAHDGPQREPDYKCMSCAGIPDARVVDRVDCYGEPVGVDFGFGVVCHRCLQPYAPPAPLRIVGVISSSAGMAAEHGRLFGMEMK